MPKRTVTETWWRIVDSEGCSRISFFGQAPVLYRRRKDAKADCRDTFSERPVKVELTYPLPAGRGRT